MKVVGPFRMYDDPSRPWSPIGSDSAREKSCDCGSMKAGGRDCRCHSKGKTRDVTAATSGSPRTIVANVKTHDGRSSSRTQLGRAKARRSADALARKTSATVAAINALTKTVDQIARTQARVRALDYIINPPAETRANLDRAAMRAAWRDQANAERAKLRKMQADADAHYGRTTR